MSTNSRYITSVTFNQRFVDITGQVPVYDTQKVDGKDHTPVFQSRLIFPPGSANVLGTVVGRGPSIKEAKADLISIIAEKFPFWERLLSGAGPMPATAVGEREDTSIRPIVPVTAESFDRSVSLNIPMSADKDVLFYKGELRIGGDLKFQCKFMPINSYPSQNETDMGAWHSPGLAEVYHMTEKCKSFALITIVHDMVIIYTTPDTKVYSPDILMVHARPSGEGDFTLQLKPTQRPFMEVRCGTSEKLSEFLYVLKRFYLGPTK